MRPQTSGRGAIGVWRRVRAWQLHRTKRCYGNGLTCRDVQSALGKGSLLAELPHVFPPGAEQCGVTYFVQMSRSERCRLPRPSTHHKRSRAFVARQGRSNVRSGEVVSLEQERLARCFGQGVGEAVAKVEPCRMVSFPEASPGAASLDKLLCRHWRQVYAGAFEKRVEFVSRGHASATFENDGRL